MPLHAARRRAAATARAIGVAERQPELPREVRAEEERQVGAVGLEVQAARPVLVEPQMIVEEVTRRVAEHRLEMLPARLGVERIVEKTLDPCRVEKLGSAVPRALDRPRSARRRASRRIVADSDRVAGIRGGISGRQAGAIRAHGGNGGLDRPPRRRRAATLVAPGERPSVRILDRERASARRCRDREDAHSPAGSRHAWAREERHVGRRATRRPRRARSRVARVCIAGRMDRRSEKCRHEAECGSHSDLS